MCGKRWLPVAGIVLGLCMVLLLPTAARADYYEGWFDDLGAEWLKFNEPVATEEPGTTYWYSGTVPDGFAKYEYKAQLTTFEVQFYNSGQFLDVTDDFIDDPTEFYMEGIVDGPLGFTIYEDFVEAYNGDEFVLKADIWHGVAWHEDAGAQQLCTVLANVDLGSYLTMPMTDIRLTLATGILPTVPEPGTLALFGMGAVVGLVAWRRRRK